MISWEVQYSFLAKLYSQLCQIRQLIVKFRIQIIICFSQNSYAFDERNVGVRVPNDGPEGAAEETGGAEPESVLFQY